MHAVFILCINIIHSIAHCTSHLSHKRPTHLSYKCHIPIMFNLTLQLCVEIFHMMNIHVPAGVGAPPLNTQLLNMQV